MDTARGAAPPVTGARPSLAGALRRDGWWLFLLALVIQAFWAFRLQHPTYFDAYYYTTNAQRLAAGKGFTEEIIWHYLDNPSSLPHASFTYWMPLTSIIGAAGYALFDSFRGAQLPFWLMAALLPLLAYTISWHLAQERWQARTAALLTAAGGYYAAYWNQPTTFVLFAWAGGGCLLALGLAYRDGNLGYWLIAGLTAGLAHLTRADGLLLLLLGVVLWLFFHKELGGWSALLTRKAWGRIALLVGGYLLVMGGWFWRTLQVTGQPMASGGVTSIFLTSYNDLFAYQRPTTIAAFLDWGWRNILTSRLHALSLAIQTYVAVVGLTAFSFFSLLGWFVARREQGPKRRLLRPFTWYAVLLLITMSLLFTFPGQRGSLLHSSTALWPWAMALVPLGLEGMVRWIAARRRQWQPRQATRIFSVAFVLMALVITLAVSGAQPLWEEQATVYEALGAALPAGSVVMTGDPPGFYYHTGLRAIVTPNEPPQRLPEIAHRYGADYLLLDAERPPPLNGLYERTEAVAGLNPLRDLGGGYYLYQFVPESGGR
jgi:hypothetical protein